MNTPDTPFDDTLLSRVEDAGLNASAPPRQRWLDGWLLRTQPGKARRARCINALAAGRLALDDKLALARAWFDECGVPMVIRITPFSQPAGLDAALAQRGWQALDNTQVLVCAQLPAPNPDPPAPPGLQWLVLDAAAFAEAVGALRGSPALHQAAHTERLLMSPVPYRGLALARADGQVMACGQYAREGPMVGLYDVFTHPDARNQGLAATLCKRLLTLSASAGDTLAYLQVDAQNAPALAVYRRLGFREGYCYHYRQPPEAA